jgi:hypothetical protein
VKLFYTIMREGTPREQYNHIRIRVYGETPDYYEPKLQCKMNWQTDREKDHWYGWDMDVNAESPFKGTEQFKTALKICAMLSPTDVCQNDPAAVVTVLEKNGIIRKICDERDDLNHHFVLPEKVKDASYNRWMTWTDNHCNCSTMATDEEDAKRMLMKQYAKEVSEHGSYTAEAFEKWICAGKPVRMDDWAKCPDVRSLEEILKPMREKKVEEETIKVEETVAA